MFKVNDWIILEDKDTFASMHHSNRDILATLHNTRLQVVRIDNDGDIRSVRMESGKQLDFPITTREQQCFRLHSKSTKHGSFKIILTYIEDGKTIEEEGVTFIDIDANTVEYKYNRKKLGFIKYCGEVKLKINELKQITISTPDNERVYHIDKGVIVREHIMYDEERKFKRFKLGD